MEWTLVALVLTATTSASSEASSPGNDGTKTSSVVVHETAARASKPNRAPYSIPWALRPLAVINTLRADVTVASSDSKTAKLTVPILFLGAVRLTPEVGLNLRFGIINNSPSMGDGGTTWTNPALGASYVLSLTPELKLGLFLGATVPIGGGGGNNFSATARPTVLSGIPARSAMDNALFAVNDFTVFPGVGLAWVAHRLTLQAEATLLELFRVRGAMIDKDAQRTNLTCGLHAGYFVMNEASVGLELRYQRWLKNDTVAKTANNPAVDTLTLAVGPRLHIKLSDTLWLRPGVAFEFALDNPLGFGASGSHYRIVQIDVPLIF